LTGPITDPVQLRAIRGVEILEDIGTAESKRAREALAAGAPEARITAEGRETLERLRE
jgi:hypothetical protein